jgi:hypothetical protein
VYDVAESLGPVRISAVMNDDSVQVIYENFRKIQPLDLLSEDEDFSVLVFYPNEVKSRRMRLCTPPEGYSIITPEIANKDMEYCHVVFRHNCKSMDSFLTFALIGSDYALWKILNKQKGSERSIKDYGGNCCIVTPTKIDIRLDSHRIMMDPYLVVQALLNTPSLVEEVWIKPYNRHQLIPIH